jgi:hypothetical protein
MMETLQDQRAEPRLGIAKVEHDLAESYELKLGVESDLPAA